MRARLTEAGGVVEGGGKSRLYADWSAFERACEDVNDAPPKCTIRFCARPPVASGSRVNWETLGTDEMRRKIMPQQRETVDRVVGDLNGRALCALGMGLGKTLIGCVVARHYGGRCLFLVPGSVKTSWKRELKQWVDWDARILKGGKDAVRDDDEAVICTVDLLRTNESVKSTHWNFVVVDESHKLAGESQRTAAASPLLRDADGVLLLSGTPQLAKPAELYFQVDAVRPGVFGTREEYTKRYCDGKFNQWGVWECTGAKNEEELNFLLRKIMVRVRNDEIDLGLPPLTHETVELDVENKGKLPQLYEQEKRARETYERAPDTEKRRARERWFDLRRKLWEETGNVKVGWQKDGETVVGPGWTWFLDEYKTHPDDAYVLFAFHEKVIARLSCLLREHDVAFACITGSTPSDKRQAIVDTLQSPDGPRVALLSIGSCSEGLTLTRMNKLVFFEIDFTPGKMDQAEKRIHRPGQKRACTIYTLVAKKSHDQVMLRTLARKRAVNDAVVDGRKRARR